jgi:hypothetical protein
MTFAATAASGDSYGFLLIGGRRLSALRPRCALFSGPARNPTENHTLTLNPSGDFDMPSSTDLRRQAARCLRIAASFQDQSVVAALIAMADEFSAKADEIDPGLSMATGLRPTARGPAAPARPASDCATIVKPCSCALRSRPPI